MKFLLLPQTLAFAASAIVSGAMLLYSANGKRGGARSVTPAEVTQLINNSNAIVIDLRDSADFANGSVTSARHVPAAELASRAQDLARFKTRPVVLLCASGTTSAKSIATLSTAGFTEVYNLAGGITAWREAGLPLVKPATKEQQGVPKKEKT